MTVAAATNSMIAELDCAPVMIPLPAGRFVMGENDADRFANPTERPRHEVHLRQFAMGKTRHALF
jgi:formylglycine-generating enzyme required for sulfatase activity